MSTKIVTTAMIEKCEVKQGGVALKFAALKLTSAQIQLVAELIQEEEPVEITIKAAQEKLFDSATAKKDKP